MPTAVLPPPEVLQAAAHTLERELPADLQRARGAFIVPSLSPGSRVDKDGGTGDLAPGRLLEAAAHPDTDEEPRFPYARAEGPARWSDDITDRDSRFPRALLVKHAGSPSESPASQPVESNTAIEKPTTSRGSTAEPAKAEPIIRKHSVPVLPSEKAGAKAIDTLRPTGGRIRWAHVVEEVPAVETEAVATTNPTEHNLEQAEIAPSIPPVVEKEPAKAGRLRRLGRKVVALAAVAGIMVGVTGDKHEEKPSAGTSVGAAVSLPGVTTSPGDVVSIDDVSDAERVGASVVTPTDSTHASRDRSVGWDVGAAIELPSTTSSHPQNQNSVPSTPPSASIPPRS